MDAERDALVALYHATNGPSWHENRGWCTDAPLSEWYGVKVKEGHVVELELFENNLQGEDYPPVTLVSGMSDRCRAIGVTIIAKVVKIMSDRVIELLRKVHSSYRNSIK